MAFASSVALKAQVPVACDLCETMDNVDWYCTDCAETLCVTCQVSHARSKASRDHLIIPRENALRYKTENTTSKDGIFCETHGGGKFELHCDDCDVMVCRKCITGDHKGHTFTDIHDVAEIRKKTFNDEVESILDNFIPEIDVKLRDIKNRREEHSESNNELQKRLRKQRDDVITTINEWYNTLDKQVDENTDNTTKALDSDEENLKKCKDALLLKVGEWKNGVLNCTPVVVLRYLKGVQGIFNQRDNKAAIDTTITNMFYTPGEISKNILRGMLGSMSLLTVQFNPKSPKIILTLGCEFKVERIVAVSPWLAYASNTSKTCLTVVDAEKMITKGEIEFGFKVGAFDVSFQREIYICLRGEKCVKKYSKDLSTSVFVSTAPYIPRGICVTGAGEVVIGTQSSSASSQLLRYSDQGRLKDKTEQYFEAPDYICENKNGDIGISDSSIKLVLVFNERLDKRFDYTGQAKGFAPRGIVCDSQSCIFICDCVNDQVEVIDANGQFIQLFLTKENGVYNPWDLSIDTAGHVWIGQKGECDNDTKTPRREGIIVAKYSD